ncbi:hypothetical protein DENSPDRAFT_523049 [Dentipellis sp. KUC8613]|nr:hypothetical protein DENSPDRAFT_523049 [Dentipellis sp. KUC8613]
MAHLRLQNARPVNHVVADKLPLTPQTSALTLPMRAARPLDVRSPPRLEQNAAHTPAASNRKSSPSRSHAPPPERSHVDHGHQRSHRVAESATLTSLPKPKQEQSSRAPSNDQKSDGQKPNGDTYAEKLRGFPELIRAYDRVPWAQKGIPEMDHRIVGSSSGSAGPINGTLTRTTISRCP